MKLSTQQEHEIYPILDRVLDLQLGKGVLYKCAPARADYLRRMIHGLRYDTAIESIDVYAPDEPFYGIGIYGHLWAEVHDQGLVVTNLTTPFVTPQWQLIQCAALRETQELYEVTCSKARGLLTRMQKKYPHIMCHVFIEDGVPPRACYGEADPEQLLVVDVDVDPDGPLAEPTQQDKAKALRATTER